ncbi:MAG TPA: alpha/beta hydrolase [Lacipirellulaceae bacterium]|jgi:acetyl esterase/lipase
MNKNFLFAGLVFFLWPIAVAAAELRSDIEYATADGESLKLDVSVPDGAGPFPVVLVIHGGGWSRGSKAEGMKPLVGPLTDGGFTWFSINYRLAPAHPWPTCIDDVRSAIRWVKAHAAEYKGDPQKVALLGYSAGGHLAAFAAATADDDTRVQGVVLFAGPVSLEDDIKFKNGLSTSLQGLFGHGKEMDDQIAKVLHDASANNFLTAKFPPCLLIHGTEDKSVAFAQSENLKARLDELRVPCELVSISGGDHHIDQWEHIDPSYGEKMVAWLNKTLSAGK